MMTIIGAVLGLFTSALPTILKLFQAKEDHKHELAVMQLQIQAQQAQSQQRLEEIRAQSDAALDQAVYQFAAPGKTTWADKLAVSVRPVITYAFFLEYALLKAGQFFTLYHVVDGVSAWQVLLQVWGDADMALFSTII